jgi:hypothetical protein
MKIGSPPRGCFVGTLVAAVLTVIAPASVAQPDGKPNVAPVVSGEYRVGDLRIALRADNQTLARLTPASDPAFSFVPGQRDAQPDGDGYNCIGDLNLRVRTPGGAWRDFASAHARKPVRPLPATGRTIAAADITASMGQDTPFTVERRWVDEAGKLGLRFRITNRSGHPLEIGVLAMPMVFDNILTERSLDQAHAQASFVDPYIGRDAGYLQVTRLNGGGPALLVLPEHGTPLEAYVPLKMPAEDEDNLVFSEKSQRAQTFEGFYAWAVYSAGFAQREWAKAGEQWNTPSSRTLAPGQTLEVGVRMVLSPSIRAIEHTLADNKRPVVVGVPGYVVPTDQRATLFVKALSAVARIDVQPSAALAVTRHGKQGDWARLDIRGQQWGRARLTLTYTDGEKQTVNYFVTKPLEAAMADLGRFAAARQWYDKSGDAFGRAPAFLTYDRETNRIVDTDPRVWIAGLSDEGGAGSWLAAIMKQLDNPDAGELSKIERFVDETLVGKLQVADGEHAGGVRKSMFYYDPDSLPGLYADPPKWGTWTSWKKKDADSLARAYNYPHVAAAHWVLYRLARNSTGLIRRHHWRWYLDHAYQTVVAMVREDPKYTAFGLMEGDVLVDILEALQREGMPEQAENMTRLMRARAEHWRSLKYPFGSEMPWDSTGQPEVYAWMNYFGFLPQAASTREVILGYDPTIPSWGYNGNARRYWDFLYGGKYDRVERQIHHYGSTLNAVPLLDAFRRNPDDLYLLRVGYGGLMGGVTNIDEEGFASAGFHSWSDMMKWDPLSGDYGMGLFGHAYAAATYVVNDPTFGWLGFGGDVSESGGEVKVVPRDGARSRLFIAPAGQWIELEAGKIASARYLPASGKITLTLDPANEYMTTARIYLQPTTAAAPALAIEGATEQRGAFAVPLMTKQRTVTLVAR